ncbi:hypothetical protein UA08_06751 [Talaromyces atroroseus]|uniref:Cell wall protein n=1 Tax=Talaromyces atroroseus TaxID=1441469 RepID=A0A225AB83_TALAT|nr:hypothetical protein UA08_06751 [Talaromyces atroroseus]OKL58281.1 hypothetical protein UA08_06751 [Talaromyces atroroseus]
MRFATLAISALATCAIARPAPMSHAPAPVFERSLLSAAVDLLDPAAALDGLSAEGAAAWVGASLGLEASVIDVSARTDLATWIGGASVNLDASVVAAIKDWCNGASSAELDVEVIAEISLLTPFAIAIAAAGDLVVDVEGIVSVGAAVGVVLEASLQATLETFIAANADLDAEVKVALNICAAGGLVASLSADVKAALTAYLDDASCGLSASLKAAIKLWLSGTVGVGVSALGTVSTAASISASIGAAIDAAVDVSGIVSASYISSLEAWISAQTDLDADIKAWLEVCTGAESALSLDVDAVIKLTAWLFDSSCTLSAQLKAVVLVWLNVRVNLADTVSVLAAADIATLTAWIGGDIAASLSATVKGVIAVAIAGEAVVNVSVDAVAELVGVLTGCVSGIDISVDIQIILGKWVSGETCDCKNNSTKRALVSHA